MQNRWPMEICCRSQGTQTGALYQPRRVGGGGDRRETQEGETYVYLWLIHVDVWQNSTKFCKANIFQLKNE